MAKISAVIITFNEANNIARCIRSLHQVADEIIVVDSFSTDNTAAIAEKEGAKIIYHSFEGYGVQKNFAQRQAANDWILSLDADEELSAQLKQSIQEVKTNLEFNAYKFNILTNYCGKWIHHCGWYPQPKIRLWNRLRGDMSNDRVHEGWHMTDKNAPVGHLKGNLLHYSYATISDHIRKLEQYSEIKAQIEIAKGKKVSIFNLWITPKWVFFVDYIIRRGFLDGYYGYLICRLSAFSSYVKYAKIRQYSEKK
ncbi:MAG: glycosyltransferase family 2 protein [Taibaiella sp.]|nr:glycosyltransferase family 2 protein [Taibaiella sp.]